MIGIYKITNKLNNKIYIGQASNIERRLKEHKQKRTLTIDDYINVIGVENFNFEILEECSLDELNQKEIEYINLYDSINNGYNIQAGGLNNSQGEGNGRAKLTYDDVKCIRQAYAEHKTQKEIYELFKNKISFAQFQGVWQGRSWSDVMPEVFTKENKDYYIFNKDKKDALLSPQQVFKYRKYYVDHTANETYDYYTQQDKPLLKKDSFRKILTGDVRPNSIYKDIPIYKKTLKRWELNNKPVSTIPETWE